MDETNLRLLDLQANMLWHTDSTFLPVPALANILQARVVPDEGGATEFASTRAGFQALAPELQERLRTLTLLQVPLLHCPTLHHCCRLVEPVLRKPAQPIRGRERAPAFPGS